MNRLKELRKKAGYTQMEIQTKLKIDQSDYSKIERGVRDPTMEQAIILAKFYKTSLDYIMNLTDEQRPYPPNIQK